MIMLGWLEEIAIHEDIHRSKEFGPSIDQLMGIRFVVASHEIGCLSLPSDQCRQSLVVVDQSYITVTVYYNYIIL